VKGKELIVSKIRVMTDTTVNLPPEVIEKHRIEVIPYTIQFGEESYLDGIDMTPQEFDEKCAATGIMPKTAFPSAAVVADGYRQLAQEGAETVVAVHVGSKMSGLYGASEVAASEVPEVDAVVVDTGFVSWPVSFIALEAARAAEAGKTKEEIAALTETVKENCAFFATSVELEYIKSSGRIVGAEEAADTGVKVKTIITIEDGVPGVAEKVRTQKAALRRMIELVKENAGGRPIKMVGVSHANREAAALDFKKQVEEGLGVSDVFLAELGLVLTVHLGPGSLTLGAYYGS
jgi:DegV family protein with EDD domain